MLYQPQITPIQSSKLLPAANTGASNGSKNPQAYLLLMNC